MRGLLVAAAGAVLAASVAIGSADAQSTSAGSAKANWQTNVVTQLTVTPNYAGGYGPQGGTGSGSTPAPGTRAALGSGYVDFGTVVAGYRYIYKNAASVSVMSNDANGFTVYAEGSTDFSDGGTNTLSIANALSWLLSSSSNTPFSPSTPFEKTASPVTSGGQNIAYGGAPPATAMIWSSSTSTLGQPNNTATKGYDYELNVPSSAPLAAMTLYVVYTAVPN
jgi:hypothetical protein